MKIYAHVGVTWLRSRPAFARDRDAIDSPTRAEEVGDRASTVSVVAHADITTWPAARGGKPVANRGTDLPRVSLFRTRLNTQLASEVHDAVQLTQLGVYVTRPPAAYPPSRVSNG